MSSVRLKGLHHVQVAMPEGAEDVARAFYGGRLGLMERPKPDALYRRGGVWFEGEGISFHIGVETDFRPARKAHVAFAVEDLAAARKALADLDPTDIDSLPDWRRFYVADPFGNRIEILQQN